MINRMCCINHFNQLESREKSLSNFKSLGISDEIMERLQNTGVVSPTPIQERAIPLVLQGKDLIAQAQTGTGKTFAFILPILERLDLNAVNIQSLIVTPTRELALQISDEVKKLTNDMEDIHVLAVYGGQDVEKQLNQLKKNIQIVVGTPGRLLDHIKRKTIQLGNLSHLVLDEADQMLHIGFLDEVEEIIKHTPSTRQTMLFSATMPSEIRNLAKKHMKEPEYIQVEKKQGPALTVNQVAFHTIDRAKQATLIHLIETYRPYLAVIFCRTKRRVSKLYEVLKSKGFSCDELHGDLSQAKREQVMRRFRDAEVQLLIATDVAARGLDVEGVTHVFNYDIPQDSESYIHRIGRTGRAGMTGMAITFYSSADRPTLDMIENDLSIRIPKQNLEKKNSNENQNNNTMKKNNEQKSVKKTRHTGNTQNGKRKNSRKSDEFRSDKGKNPKRFMQGSKVKGKSQKKLGQNKSSNHKNGNKSRRSK